VVGVTILPSLEVYLIYHVLGMPSYIVYFSSWM
jgi:hypothetical protein